MKKRIKFYKSLIIEIVETLCSICLYLERDGKYTHNIMSQHMRNHFEALKKYSENMRGGE